MKEHPLRTTVIGSLPFPGWLEFSCQHLAEFGEADREELKDDAVIAAVYVVPTAGKAIRGENGATNSVSLDDSSGSLLRKILHRAGARTAVLAMGNPYLAQDFPEVQNYLCTFSNVPISEASVTKALFGEIATHGHLPVSIPNIARRGAGIEREAQLTPGESDHANSKPNGQ